jgi:hypothetical protein
MRKLFDLFTTQLIKGGVVAREGSIVDASFVNVPRQRNTLTRSTFPKVECIGKANSISGEMELEKVKLLTL